MKKAAAAPAPSTTTATATPAVPSTTPASGIRIVKIGRCPNLSESAKLGYHIGCNAESKIQLRVFSNSGKGFFSKEWVSLDAILKAIDKCPKDKPLNGFWLGPLYAGKSINTPSFLMAVLLAEGLVQKVERNYEKVSHEKFVSEVNTLIESGTDLKVDDKPQKPSGKPVKTKDKPKADDKPQQVEGKAQKVDVKPENTEAQIIEGNGQKVDVKPENIEPKPRRAATGKKATPKAMPQKKA